MGGKAVTSENPSPPITSVRIPHRRLTITGYSRTPQRALRVTRRDTMSPDRHPVTDLTVVYS